MLRLLKGLMKEDDHNWLSREINKDFFPVEAGLRRRQEETPFWYDFADEVRDKPLYVAARDVFTNQDCFNH
jgi:hypothetical protein